MLGKLSARNSKKKMFLFSQVIILKIGPGAYSSPLPDK
jgi:hypothetical protein